MSSPVQVYFDQLLKDLLLCMELDVSILNLQILHWVIQFIKTLIVVSHSLMIFVLLEIHCINENEEYFAIMIHDLGLTLKTTAVCKQIRCIRYGCFTVEDALLRKHWSLKYLPDHMSLCHTKLKTLPRPTPQLSVYEQPSSSQIEKCWKIT
jgi:tRNA U55 pseudouridine synthase TruB